MKAVSGTWASWRDFKEKFLTLDKISDSMTWPEGVWSGCLNTAILGCSSRACFVCSEHTDLVSLMLETSEQLTGQNCSNFFVNDDIDLDSPLGGSQQHPVNTIVFILARRSSQIELC